MRISQHNHQQEAILRLIRERRLILSREGGRKLYCWLKPKLESMGIKVGRDKLFDLLREKDMLVYRKKDIIKQPTQCIAFISIRI